MNLGRSYGPLLETHILAVLLPGSSFVLVLLARKYVGLHPPGKKALVLSEVADVDLVLE